MSTKKNETELNEIDSRCLKHLLLWDMEKTIDNLRIQRLMGINRKDGKATVENIPSIPDRSAYSCQRYQFFLDAPFEIGNQCCMIMKKNPMHKYAKDTGRKPITAQMACESRLRTQQWLNSGCNGFDLKSPISNPMSFWTESDCLLYIKLNWDVMIEWKREEYKIKYGCYPEESENPFTIDSPIASVYGDIVSDDEEIGQLHLANYLGTELFDLERPNLHTTGCNRTGCFACGYGMHHEKTMEKSRIQSVIDYSNPKMADWMLRGGHFRESDGLWEPHQGLGMAFVCEWINQNGGFNMWYPDREKYLSQLPDECWNYIERDT